MSFISIIIPVKPGLEPQAIRHLALLDSPEEALELLVAEGTNPSRQRNEAAKQANGEIIYFLDDDSLVVSDFLQRLELLFADPEVVVVGGPSLTPTTDSVLQRAFGAVLSSLLGAGGVRNRYRAVGTIRQTTERELILCNLAFRRDAFLAAGGLDERLYPNEENELLDRILKEGGKLLHDPGLPVFRSQRPTITAFLRQMFRYGRGRAEQTRIAGFNGLMPFAPLLFLFYLLSLMFVHKLFWFVPLAGYLAAIIICTASEVFERNSLLFVLFLPPLFPLLHIANGLGLLAGFILPLPDKACYRKDNISVRRQAVAKMSDGVL